jgi:putative FmdB family regulatory protein
MPTYEYKCKDCGQRFETFQSITAEPLRDCPVCGGEVQRLIGAGNGLIFKGSGFYATDYRSESYKKSKEAESKTNGKKEEKSETTSKKSDDS